MEKKPIGKGDMVSFEFEPKVSAYGIVLWIEGTVAHMDVKNPITHEYEAMKREVGLLTKIGKP